MIITAHQPVFMPYRGIIEKIRHADVLVLLDDVQYVRRGFVNRNRIASLGEGIWLTVPVVKAPRDTLIKDMVIDYSERWPARILGQLEAAYKGTPNYVEVMEWLRPLLLCGETNLAVFNEILLTATLHRMGIETKVVRSSGFACKPEDPTGRLVHLMKAIGGDVYISGPNGRKYLDEYAFDKEKLGLLYHQPHLDAYAQYKNDGKFIPNMSIIDYMMNVGVE